MVPHQHLIDILIGNTKPLRTLKTQDLTSTLQKKKQNSKGPNQRKMGMRRRNTEVLVLFTMQMDDPRKNLQREAKPQMVLQFILKGRRK